MGRLSESPLTYKPGFNPQAPPLELVMVRPKLSPGVVLDAHSTGCMSSNAGHCPSLEDETTTVSVFGGRDTLSGWLMNVEEESNRDMRWKSAFAAAKRRAKDSEIVNMVSLVLGDLKSSDAVCLK